MEAGVDGEKTGEIVQPGEATEEYSTLSGATGVDELGELPGGGDDEWPVRGPGRGIRLGLPAAGLLAVLLVAAGFWGGSVVQKDHGSSSGARGGAGGAAALVSRLRGLAGTTGATGATGATGSTGFNFGGASGATVGTISVVEGDVLYVLTSAGSLVKVTLDPSTTITRNANAPTVGLRPGDTVVVQGATAGNGDVSATSVAATAPGVSSSGFGGRGFGGGAGAGAATTTTAG
jgi:hypothetical protein